MNKKTGENDPCPCGSSRKYRDCCLDKKNSAHSFSSADYSLEQRTKIMYNSIVDIFCFNQVKEWKDLKKFITADRIKKFYEVLTALWPPNTKMEAILPRPDDGNLRALYIGRHEPELILKNVLRYTLYTDEILVFLPFPIPWCIASEFNPLINPDQFKNHMLRSIAFIQELLPWILSGYVKLIPDPGSFDFQLRKSTIDMAAVRLKEKSFIEEDDFKESSALMKKRLSYGLFCAPEDYKRRIIKESQPNLTEKEIKSVLKHMKKTVENNPFMIDEPLAESSGQIEIFSFGANLEMAMYISYLTGAYLYTDWKPKWKELLSLQKSSENSTLWTPLANAFQNLDFKFFNNVSTEFACSLRNDGRLESFRIFLRKMWNEVSKVESEISNPSTIVRNFTDELKEEFKKAQVDWGEIDKKLLSNLSVGTVATSMAGSIVTGGLNWQIPAGGFALSAIGNLLLSRYDRHRFRVKCPLSVLIDLKGE